MDQQLRPAQRATTKIGSQLTISSDQRLEGSNPEHPGQRAKEQPLSLYHEQNNAFHQSISWKGVGGKIYCLESYHHRKSIG